MHFVTQKQKVIATRKGSVKTKARQIQMVIEKPKATAMHYLKQKG